MSIVKRKNIAIAIALLFHICGAIGILFSPYKNWFIQNASFNLLVMTGLLIFTQPSLQKNFFFFFLISFLVGFGVEIIGTKTSILFGSYTFGNSMGIRLWGVPLLIGVQWFVTIFCCGAIMHFVNNWAQQKITEYDAAASESVKSISLIIDAALLATFFDYIIEPVAQKLGYWQWTENRIPFFNYTCWFLVSGLLLLILNKLSFNKQNPFAIHLFIIQLLFYIALRIFFIIY